MDVNDTLNALEQQPMCIYTQICLCYSLDPNASQSAIVDTLTTGLERLTESFPWIAGHVVNEGAGEGITGTYSIRPFQKIPQLIVKNVQDDASAPTMESMRKAEFPFRMLDETLVAPRMTIPGTNGEDPSSDPMPVFMLQATFIKGGLVLNFNGQHQAMDMTGQGQAIDLFAKACRGEPFTSEDLSTGNVTRRNLIPVFDDSWELGNEIDHQMIKPSAPSDTTESSSDEATPDSVWAYFLFSGSSLSELKASASKTTTLTSGYISTDDTLSAFVWQSVVRARQSRFDPNAKASFARAVDVRRYLGISSLYPGMLQNMAYHSYPLSDLLKEPLGGVASTLRRAVDPKTTTLAHDTKAGATTLSRMDDKTKFSYAACMNLALDLMLSSWAKLDCYDLDFNMGLGKPEAVRRPQFIPVESLAYLMPKTPDGEIALGIGLREDDMERLKSDEEFTKYGRFIG